MKQVAATTIVNKIISIVFAIAFAICILMPAPALSQAFRLVHIGGRSETSNPPQSNTSLMSSFTLTNLNDSDADILLRSILTANKNTDIKASPGGAEIWAAQRGNPFINFENGKTIAAESANFANATPLALASGDFDGDGVEDLAIAYATSDGAIISIRRGNVESIFPPNVDAEAAPFFAETQTFEILLAPDYLAAGDFNGDGKQDLLAAKRGSAALILLAGNGDGNFAVPQAIELKGEVTAFATGEVNNFDNLADFAIGIIEKNNPKVLIFQNRGGAFSAEPEVLKVSKAVNALAFGELDTHISRDLVAASGDELVLISGRVKTNAGEIKSDRITRRKLDFQIAALAIGDFTGERENEIAILSQDGGLFLSVPTASSNGLSAKYSNVRINPPATAGGSDLLIAAKVSTRQKTDLIITSNNQLNLVTNDGADNLSLAATFDSMENPIAVLPMRLNIDALNDLVVLTKNQTEPSVLMTAPMAIHTVTNPSGGNEPGTLRKAMEDSNANHGLDEIRFNLPSATTPIVTSAAFPDILDATTVNGTSQSGFIGVPVIEVLRDVSSPGTAPTLTVIGGNTVLRGLISKSANSNADGILLTNAGNNFVEGNFIGTDRNGTASGGAGKNGIVVESGGNTIGGLGFPGRNIISGATGGLDSNGILISGANNRIENNYIGLKFGGFEALGNSGFGVRIDDGSGNVVGGATDAKRNVISGNTRAGLAVNKAANSFSDAVIENNFIGTTKNGDAALRNAGGGVRLEYNATVAPTATVNIYDNVISGNTGDGVYAVNSAVPPVSNAAPNGGGLFLIDLARRPGNLSGAANFVSVPGNKIGTNSEGTAALPNTGNGVNLKNAPANIEGNLISGNLISGVKIEQQTSQLGQLNVNRIGTNASGNAAIGNGSDGVTLELEIAAEINAYEITDNIISGNTGDGIRAFRNLNNPNGNIAPLQGAGVTVDIYSRRASFNSANGGEPLTGNLIGVNSTGTAALPNGGNGVSITDLPSIIGGDTPDYGNTISGNVGHGIELDLSSIAIPANNSPNAGFRVAAKTGFCSIGTNSLGTAAIPNGGDGIKLGAPANLPPTSIRINSNTISGNGSDGIEASGGGILIDSNKVGTNADGTAALGNGEEGIKLDFSSGGAGSGLTEVVDNVISGNVGNGLRGVAPLSAAGVAPTGGAGVTVDIYGRSRGQFTNSFGGKQDGNYIGVNADGTAALPNGGHGILLTNTAANIEGNLISGNGMSGINAKPPITTDLPFEISDNYIGTDASGNVDLGNTGDGISLEYSGIVHVDAKSTEIINNVISGNNGDGVKSVGNNLTFPNFTANKSRSDNNSMPTDMHWMPSIGRQTQNLSNRGTSKSNNAMPLEVHWMPSIGRQTTNLREQVTSENLPMGNRIGTNAAGTAALPNGGNGVNLQNVPALVEGNLISANGMSGIRANPPITTDLPFEISDNYIGTDASGNVDLGNTGDGITLEYSGTAHIDAKTSDILSNVISGNSGDGIRIFGNAIFANNAANPSGSNNNVMPQTTSYFANIARQTQSNSKSNLSKKNNVMPQNSTFFANIARQSTNLNQQMTTGNLPLGNRVGTNAAGTAALGNAGHGISITNIPSKIGGETLDDGNIIAHNGLTGVAVFSGAGNLIQSNSIFSNASLGIDLGGDGLTLNDLLDADTGANNLQNYPVVTSASSNGSLTSVSGTINTTPNTALTIQFYATSDGSTNFGGSPFGTLLLTTNASGNASFSATFPVGLTTGRFVSATATTDETNAGNENNTSEFSPGVLVFAPTSATVTVSGRILSPQGAGVAKASVTLVAPNGVTRTVLASSLGLYRFEDVPVGETYVFSVSSKRFTFASRVVFVTEEMTVDFTAVP